MLRFNFKLPSKFKLIGSLAAALLLFMTGGAFADEVAQTGSVTPDVMDKFTNLGLAILVAHMWSKDAERKDAFIRTMEANHQEEKDKFFERKDILIKTLLTEHQEEKNKLIELVKDFKPKD